MLRKSIADYPNVCYQILVLNRLISRSSAQTKWKSVVGLEVHAQISSESKLFSGASTKFSSPVNTNVSLFDCSIPGTLPVLNKKCVQLGVLTALALNCKINPVSMFDRKHYFYADLPTGYQITQQRQPLALDGNLQFDVFTPGIHKKPYRTAVKIKQLQLEQDSAKSLHDYDRSIVDLNRAGVPLMEIVFEPDLKDGEEAAALVKELVAILHRIKTCSCKMEEGAIRVDANVSIHQEGDPLGVRTETKNIGSIRGVAGAIKYEIERQIKIKESGGLIINETRAWDAPSKTTVAMRDKEETQDYRYMPEPNLPPLHIAMGAVSHGCVNADELRKSLPELPEKIRLRLQEDLGLTLEQSIILVGEYFWLEFFENAVRDRQVNGRIAANLLINDFITLLHKRDLELFQVDCKPEHFGETVTLLQQNSISRNTARLLLEEIIEGNKDSPLEIVEKKDWLQITDDKQLTELCEQVLNENEKIVKQFKSGKIKVFKALLGSVAGKSNQRADMVKCDVILKKLLNKK